MKPRRPIAPPSYEARAERLRRMMTIGSAVCIRTETPLAEIDLIMRWREDVGLGFPRGDTERAHSATLDDETRVLLALGAARPANNSFAFETFDRAAVVWADQDARPISLVTETAGLGEVWVSGPLQELDIPLMQAIGGHNDLPLLDEGLLRTALDAKSDSLGAFLAAWAALERLIGKAYRAHLDSFLAARPESLTASVRDAQRRVLETGHSGPSITNQFLILRWGLCASDGDEDEALFRRLNERRRNIYHRGDTGEVRTARDEAVKLLLILHRLAAANAATFPESSER
jgi:hypothetical protein